MNIKNSKFIIIALLVIIVLFISKSWFKADHLFATAEEGPVFYSLARTAGLKSDAWTYSGTGFVSTTELPIGLFAKIFSFFELFLSNFQIQILVFSLIILGGFAGTYLLSLKITEKKHVSLIASLFYFFNLFTMSQVWKRSLYVGMFSWAYLPLYTYLFINWIEEKKIKYLIYYVILNFLFLWTFSNPAYLFSFVAVSLSFLVYYFYKNKNFKKRLGGGIAGLIILITTLVINIWWIYPFASNYSSTYAGYSTIDRSFKSLRGVSVAFPLSEIILLKQKYYFDSSYNPQMPDTSWGTWYEGAFPLVISIGIFFIALFGWWSMRKRRYFPFLSILVFLGLFISKGTNTPLGHPFYKWLFESFPFTIALRNPYEKFGIVWLLPYALFFGVGLIRISEYVRKSLRKYIVGMCLFLSCGLLVWPLWTGKVFEKYYFVKIPDYYEELNNFLNNDKDDIRILMLPMIPDHGARFSWGYRGTEPSEYLLDKTTISKQIRTNKLYAGKYDELMVNIKEKGKLEEILIELNIKYLIIRNDLEWETVGSISPEVTEKNISTYKNIKLVKQFGELKLFEFKDDDFGFIKAEGNATPTLTYKRASPTQYIIDVKNASEPYNLIFKETYNDNWLARIDGEKVDEHFIVYDYANAWEINKKGNYQISVVFKVWPWD